MLIVNVVRVFPMSVLVLANPLFVGPEKCYEDPAIKFKLESSVDVKLQLDDSVIDYYARIMGVKSESANETEPIDITNSSAWDYEPASSREGLKSAFLILSNLRQQTAARTERSLYDERRRF